MNKIGKIAACFAVSIMGACFSAEIASATSLTENTTYQLDGKFGFVLDEAAKNDGADFRANFSYTGLVTIGANFDDISVALSVSGGEIKTFDGTQVVGSFSGGHGYNAYKNAQTVTNSNGNVGAAVYSSSFDPNNPVRIGGGAGPDGSSGALQLLGELNGVQISGNRVKLDPKSLNLNETDHHEAYLPFSPLGAFMASFGEHGVPTPENPILGLSYHAWTMSAANSFLTLADGTQYRLYGDFHGTLQPSGSEIPEPASMLLLGSALAALRLRRESFS